MAETVVSTSVAAEESADELHIDVGESCIAPSPIPRTRPPARRTPTFENLTVVAAPSRAWLYATSAAAFALVAALLFAVR